MFANSLVFVALTVGAPPEHAGPRLEKGLEVRWTGTFSEATFRPGVSTLRNYDVETRLFVLDATVNGAEVALFTRVFLKNERAKNEPASGVVRIDLAKVSPLGQVQILPSPADPDNPDAKLRPWPQVQLQGLPTHEAGMFIDFPERVLKVGLSWSREEKGRPNMNWKVTELDIFRGQPAVKIVASQKTDGYYGDKIRHGEWRRQDTLTVPTERGFASRIERIVERRDPEAEELSFRSVLSMEQQGRISYSGRLYQERREEAINAAALMAMLDRMLAAGGKEGPKPFEALARRAKAYLSDHAANDTIPYQEAVQVVRKRAESAANGNLPPAAPPEPIAVVVEPLTLGKSIADITIEGITSPGSIKLSDLEGKTSLIVYFQAAASSAEQVLRLANDLHHRKLGHIAVLSLGPTGPAKKMAGDMKVALAMYDATEVYKTHALEATPVFIVVDAKGIVKHVARGWGAETPASVTKEFERWSK